MNAPGLPRFIFLGAKRPELRLMDDAGEQLPYSLTNINVYTTSGDLTGEPGTLSLANLLRGTGGIIGWGLIDHYRLPNCYLCLSGRRVCPMLVDKVEETAYGPDITKEVAVRKLRLKMHERPQLEKCNTLKVLLELSQTGPEKQLFSMYCEAVISGIDLRQVSAYDFEFTVLQESSLVHQYGSLWEAKLLNLPASSRSPSALTAAMLNSLGQPALLPQYWLDWTYDPKAPSHSLPRPTLDMPTRIDFFAFRNGKRMAIEVDGPEHYANFDRQNGKYVLSEEVYAKNLRIDRSMRFQGWKIHRVSNWEVNAQPNRALADLADALELPLEGWGVEPLLPGLPDIRDLPF